MAASAEEDGLDIFLSYVPLHVANLWLVLMVLGFRKEPPKGTSPNVQGSIKPPLGSH